MKTNIGFGVEIEMASRDNIPQEASGLIIKNTWNKLEVDL